MKAIASKIRFLIMAAFLVISACTSQNDVPAATAHQFIRDDHTSIVRGEPTYIGDAQIKLSEPSKVFTECNVSIQESPVPEWIGLSIRLKKGETTVQLDDSVFHTPQANYSSWSVAGILTAPEEGSWVVQCVLQRGETGPDPIVHTYSVTAFQIK